MKVDYILENLRQAEGITLEQHEENLRKAQEESQVTQLQLENEQLKKRVEYAEEALLVLMDMGGM